MTEDQKKALYIVGGVAALGVVAWFLSGQTTVVAGASPTNPQPLPQYTANVPAYEPGQVVINSRLPASVSSVQGGCCSSNDGCFTTGGINTGNAPLSLDQLLAWYGGSNPGFTDALNKQFSVLPPDNTIMALTSPPPVAPTNVPF